jgi:hypothetical protein
MLFALLHYSYILRSLWIEWELFLPLRYDFLENGDFAQEKYKEQYRKTCLVEYVPQSLKHGESLYKFFDALFPKEVVRGEVLLNTEYIRSLIHKRMKHIKAYESVYAKKVHKRATYMRDVEAFEKSGPIRRSCRGVKVLREPKEPLVVVANLRPREDMGNVFIKQTKAVRDAHTYEALPYHFE